jgi:hypothetical protein
MIGVSAGGGIDLGSSDSDGSGGSSALMAAQDNPATSDELPRAYDAASTEEGAAAADDFSGTPQTERSAEGPPSETPSSNAYTALRNTPASVTEGEDAADTANGGVEAPVPGTVGVSADDDDDNRIFWAAQAILAAIALGSGGLAFAAWRRTR